MKRAAAVLLFLALSSSALLGQRYAATGKVVNSRHDLSVTSTGSTYKATAQSQVCVFCHTPHNANPAAPLWNHTLSSGFNYDLYSSSTLTATISQPTSSDSSKLCLSCHDGTVALGSTVNNGNIAMQGGITLLPLAAGTTYTPPRNTNLGGTLGKNLTDDHPVAFRPTFPALPTYPQVKTPAAGDAVTLDPAGKVQCVSCHNPHEESKDATEKRFLVKNNSSSAICVTCHDLQSSTGSLNTWSWSGVLGQVSDHKTKTNPYDATTNAGGVTWLGSHTGYTTTATNGCEACHRPHTAHDVLRLLKGQTDQVCFQCHDGNTTTNIFFPPPLGTTRQNMVTAFSPKTYPGHPGTGATQTGHDPNETPPVSTSRHGACDDCHNPHAAKGYAVAPVPPTLSPPLYGVAGVASDGTVRDPRRSGGDARYEYEICFKCHADSTNKPQGVSFSTYGRTVFRKTYIAGQDQINYNIRLQFNSLFSWHNVVQPLSGRSVPSLRNNMLNLDSSLGRALKTANSYLLCTDCHNNDQARISLGNGPNGPHGSNWTHLLERRYLQEPLPASPGGSTAGVAYVSGIAGTYALCYKCHDIGSGATSDILQDQTFKKHDRHITGADAACSTCHAPHGIQGGTVTNNERLVNFDLNVVGPDGLGRLYFQSDGVNTGRCYLRCHNVNHNPKTY